MKGTDGHDGCRDALRQASTPVRSLGLIAMGEGDAAPPRRRAAAGHMGGVAVTGDSSSHPSCVLDAGSAGFALACSGQAVGYDL